MGIAFWKWPLFYSWIPNQGPTLRNHIGSTSECQECKGGFPKMAVGVKSVSKVVNNPQG